MKTISATDLSQLLWLATELDYGTPPDKLEVGLASVDAQHMRDDLVAFSKDPSATTETVDWLRGLAGIKESE